MIIKIVDSFQFTTKTSHLTLKLETWHDFTFENLHYSVCRRVLDVHTTHLIEPTKITNTQHFLNLRPKVAADFLKYRLTVILSKSQCMLNHTLQDFIQLEVLF